MRTYYIHHPVVLKDCVVLGGVGLLCKPGNKVNMEFGSRSLAIKEAGTTTSNILYAEFIDLSITGPGTITSGGGFIGGGFGVESALEGMAVAGVLNLLTTRTKIHTFVTLQTNTGELHLHYAGMEPSALRIALSAVFTTLRNLDPQWMQSRMDRLNQQLVKNLIESDEYDAIKEKLLYMAKAEPVMDKQIDVPRLEPIMEKQINGDNAMCPNCDATITLLSLDCPKCTASFREMSVWRPVPI